MKFFFKNIWKKIGPLISFWVVSHPWIKRLILFFLGIFPDVKDMIRSTIYGSDEAAPRLVKYDVNLISPETRVIYQDLTVAMQKSESEPKYKGV